MLGIAYAGMVTNLTTFAIIKIFIMKQPSLKETNVPFCDKSTFDKEGLLQYTILALPLIATTTLGIWVWEQMTLAAGLISMEDQACQVIIINLLLFCFMFGCGM
jgi:hypothetical protein